MNAGLIQAYYGDGDRILTIYGTLIFEIYREALASGRSVVHHRHRIFSDATARKAYTDQVREEFDMISCDMKDVRRIIEDTYFAEINTLVGYTILVHQMENPE